MRGDGGHKTLICFYILLFFSVLFFLVVVVFKSVSNLGQVLHLLDLAFARYIRFKVSFPFLIYFIFCIFPIIFKFFDV